MKTSILFQKLSSNILCAKDVLFIQNCLREYNLESGRRNHNPFPLNLLNAKLIESGRKVNVRDVVARTPFPILCLFRTEHHSFGFCSTLGEHFSFWLNCQYTLADHVDMCHVKMNTRKQINIVRYGIDFNVFTEDEYGALKENEEGSNYMAINIRENDEDGSSVRVGPLAHKNHDALSRQMYNLPWRSQEIQFIEIYKFEQN